MYIIPIQSIVADEFHFFLRPFPVWGRRIELSISTFFVIVLLSLLVFLRVYSYTVVPALGDPRRERPPAVCGHFVNVPTHFKVKLPVISGHLPNADADSHLLVVSTCIERTVQTNATFRWSFQPKIAGAHPNLRPTDISNFRAVVW